MSVKWSNVIVLALAVLSTVVLVRGHEAIGAFFETIQSIGSGAPDQELMGFLAYGFILVLVVAVTKILVEANKK